MEIDFSHLNLKYLLKARDYVREDPDRIAAVLGMDARLARLLAETTAEELVQETFLSCRVNHAIGRGSHSS